MIAVPSFLQTPTSAGYGFGASITESGFALLPISFAMLIAGIVTGRVRDALRLEGAARGRLRDQRARHAVPGRRARQRVELLRGDGARRARHRLRVLGDVEPRRRGGAAPPDRRRDRHERQRPHDRRLDRQPDRVLDHRRASPPSASRTRAATAVLHRARRRARAAPASRRPSCRLAARRARGRDGRATSSTR